MKTTTHSRLVKLVKMAVMVAVSCVLVLLIRIPFPPAPFLVYDPADIPIMITGFAFGPIAGVIVTILVSFIQAFILGGDGIYGFLMHVIATGTFVLVSASIYKFNKTRKGAIMALVIGVLTWVVVMCMANYFITPAFMGVPTEAVVAMILPIIIPFNFLKAGINSVITFLLYKRLSGFLHKQ